MNRTNREENAEERSGGEASQFQFAYCSVPAVPPRQFPAVTDPARLDAIVATVEKWGNGTVFRYYIYVSDAVGVY